jgi:hypothetical protein
MIEIERQQSRMHTDSPRQAVVLAVQDTTSFNFSGRQIAGLGVLDDNRTRGFFAHTTLNMSVEGVPLGVADQQVWTRAPSRQAKDDAHKSLPIDHKESYKWLLGLKQSVQHAPDQQVITVCDREGDIYELFATAQAHAAHFIVRVVRNRRTADGPLLEQALAERATVSSFTLSYPRRPQSQPQEVSMTLRYATLTLLPPKRPAPARFMPLSPLMLQVVEAVEERPPAGEKALRWLLMSTLPVSNDGEAHTILRYYSYRWLVERFHYVLKSGCHFEESQLATYAALTNHLALCSSVAWRLLWLTYQARLTPEASCESVLAPVAWQALTAFLHRSPQSASHPPTLREAVRAIARLGGFLARTGDGEPGVKVLWRGLARLDDLVSLWLILHPELVGND